MFNISENDKKRITDFISDNELDFSIVDNPISRFHINSYDGKKFQFQNLQEGWVLMIYDPKKDDIHNPGSQPFKYFQFKTLSQILEQLKVYDSNISKIYWSIILDSIQIGFDKDSYKDTWVDDFKLDRNYQVQKDDTYQYLVYENRFYKPLLNSPFNTLHEVSPINQFSPTKVEKLYFEIHPISLKESNENYLVKLLCNNDEKFPEFINYSVIKRKGLKKFLDSLFENMKQFKEC